MRVKTIILLTTITFFGCGSRIDSATYSKFQKNGNAISQKAQATLLSNVGSAIQKGGAEYAVEFCNSEASNIITGLNQEYNCSISRVSEKNRNPNTALGSTQEKELWEIFKAGSLTDTIIQKNKSLVFYKAIKIGIPACLKCHGNPESDINQATRKKLQELYPKDLATGYSLNDFRGLWKIEFERK